MGGTAAMPLIGRDAELATVTGAIGRATDGRGGTLVVEGPAGIGKTFLVDEALARADGVSIFRTSCGELERDIPFAGIAAALDVRRSSPDPAVAAIARLIGDADQSEVRFQVVDALVDHLERLALRQPLILVIDDVHRADDGTLLLLRRLVRDAPALAVAVVCTRRPHPHRDAVDEALGSSDSIALDVLSAEDVAKLAEAVVGRAPDAELTRALGTCGGNPLFASELLRALEADGRIDVTPDAASLAPGAVPVSLRLTVLAQLSFLDDAAVETLRVASCFGTTFDVGDVALTLGQPATSVLAVLDPVLRAGVLEARDDRLAFRHDLVRDAVYDDMPSSAQRALHADIARDLGAAGRPMTDVAPHLVRSARPGDIGAVEQLRDAAQALAPLSTLAAAELLERAAALAPPDYLDRADLDLDLAALYTTSGRVMEADALARGVLAVAVDPSTSRAREVIVRAHLARGAARDVIDVVEELDREELEPSGDAARRGVLVARAWRDMDENVRAVAAARVAADLATDDDTRCAALSTIALAATASFDTAQLMVVIPEILELLQRPTISLGTRAEMAAPYLFTLGGIDIVRAQARQLAADVLERLETSGHLALAPAVYEAFAFDHLRWGEPDLALLQAQAAIRAADDLGGARALTLAHSVTAVASAYLGDLTAARNALDATEREGVRAADPDNVMSGLMQARYEVEEATGHRDRATAALWHAFEHFRGGDFAMTLGAAQVTRLVRFLLDVGDKLRAREAFDALVAVGDRAGGAADDIVGVETSALGRYVLQARGLIGTDPDAALEAVGIHRGPPVVGGYFPLVWALDDAAQIFVRAGRATEAVPLLEELRDKWAAIGPNPHVDEAEARLRALGVKRGVRGPRRRATTGWDALTETELRVADLVADGLTYREIGERLFLSRRTVESHVARIFTKLDLSSRRELAQIVIARRA